MPVVSEACVVAAGEGGAGAGEGGAGAGEGGAGAGQSGQLASPGMKQAMCCGRGMH